MGKIESRDMSWRCANCKFDNDRADDACTMCQSKAPQTWSCATCTYMDNPADFLACEICGAPRVAVEAQMPAPAPVAPMPPASSAAASHPSGEDLANQALEEAKQEQVNQQHVALGKKIRSTYGDEIGNSFDALSPAGHADGMEASGMQWCKMAMEQNYFVKCGYQEQFRKKPFSREGFDVAHVHEWACEAFSIDPQTLVLEYRAPTGCWFALTSNEHFTAAVRMLRPTNSSEPFSLTVRATQRSADDVPEAAAAAEAVPPSASTDAGQPEYDAAHATQFLMLGLDGEDSERPRAEQADSDEPQWENGAQCRKCESWFGYVFNGRHHCRKCFGSFCGYCAASFHQIEADGPEVRLCETCATTF